MQTPEQEVSRITRSKADARRFYDRISGWYDLMAGSSERKYKQRCLQHLAVDEGERVLEIGVGTGECSLALARSVGEGGKVYGLDLSGGMLKVTRDRLTRAGLSQRVELSQADACRLPYESASLDAVFSSFTLELFDTPEIADVLGECLRVLRPGGRLCIASLAVSTRPGLMSRLYGWFHRHFPNVADCRPIYVEHAIQAAGFHIDHSETHSMWGLPVAVVLAHKPA